MLHFNICISEMSIVMILINCRLTLFNWYLKRPCSEWSARYDPNGRYLFAKMALWYAQLPLIAGIVGSRGRNFKSRPVVKRTFLRDFHLFFSMQKHIQNHWPILPLGIMKKQSQIYSTLVFIQISVSLAKRLLRIRFINISLVIYLLKCQSPEWP